MIRLKLDAIGPDARRAERDRRRAAERELRKERDAQRDAARQEERRRLLREKKARKQAERKLERGPRGLSYRREGRRRLGATRLLFSARRLRR